jgi:hypothetical protein
MIYLSRFKILSLQLVAPFFGRQRMRIFYEFMILKTVMNFLTLFAICENVGWIKFSPLSVCLSRKNTQTHVYYPNRARTDRKTTKQQKPENGRQD